ncbi:hypothetical protein GF312_05035 [Candidatus Poribacteria bacterium]|nr:hypothetical protein [Candidatus Poribacteria bacterium]
MLFHRKKKKKKEEGYDYSVEEMQELVDENMDFARRYARLGNVSGMEMSLELALDYAQKIKKTFDSQQIGKIKLEGYEQGYKIMNKRASELKEQGKKREAQTALKLAATYENEAKLLKYSIG